MTKADKEVWIFDARTDGEYAQALLRWHADCDGWVPPADQVEALRAALLAGATALLARQGARLAALDGAA